MVARLLQSVARSSGEAEVVDAVAPPRSRACATLAINLQTMLDRSTNQLSHSNCGR